MTSRKKIALIFMLMLCLSFVIPVGTFAQTQESGVDTTSYAQAYFSADLPEVKILPDSPFYFVKLWVEKVRLAIAKDAKQKSALLVYFAKERLAEGVVMAKEQKNAQIAQVFDRFDTQNKQAMDLVNNMDAQDITTIGVAREVEQNAVIQQQFIRYLENQTIQVTDLAIDQLAQAAFNHFEKTVDMLVNKHLSPSSTMLETSEQVLGVSSVRPEARARLQTKLEQSAQLQ